MLRVILSVMLLGFSRYLQSEDPKLLVLIIASDELPLYLELQSHWRSYMHLDPQHVEAYFIKADPHLETASEIRGDTIWIRAEESVIPGIANKTVEAMELLLPRIEQEFDFVLRTNLSSFYVFPKFLQFLKSCPRTELYGSGGVNHWYGYENDYSHYGHGCGILFSSDVVSFMVKNKLQLWNKRDCDDSLFAKFLLQENGYKLFKTDRIDLLDLSDWYRNQNCIPLDAYHFRVRYHNFSEREIPELIIHERLLKIYYPQAMDLFQLQKRSNI